MEHKKNRLLTLGIAVILSLMTLQPTITFAAAQQRLTAEQAGVRDRYVLNALTELATEQGHTLDQIENYADLVNAANPIARAGILERRGQQEVINAIKDALRGSVRFRPRVQPSGPAQPAPYATTPSTIAPVPSAPYYVPVFPGPVPAAPVPQPVLPMVRIPGLEDDLNQALTQLRTISSNFVQAQANVQGIPGIEAVQDQFSALKNEIAATLKQLSSSLASIDQRIAPIVEELSVAKNIKAIENILQPELRGKLTQLKTTAPAFYRELVILPTAQLQARRTPVTATDLGKIAQNIMGKEGAIDRLLGSRIVTLGPVVVATSQTILADIPSFQEALKKILKDSKIKKDASTMNRLLALLNEATRNDQAKDELYTVWLVTQVTSPEAAYTYLKSLTSMFDSSRAFLKLVWALGNSPWSEEWISNKAQDLNLSKEVLALKIQTLPNEYVIRRSLEVMNKIMAVADALHDASAHAEMLDIMREAAAGNVSRQQQLSRILITGVLFGGQNAYDMLRRDMGLLRRYVKVPSLPYMRREDYYMPRWYRDTQEELQRAMSEWSYKNPFGVGPEFNVVVSLLKKDIVNDNRAWAIDSLRAIFDIALAEKNNAALYRLLETIRLTIENDANSKNNLASLLNESDPHRGYEILKTKLTSRVDYARAYTGITLWPNQWLDTVKTWFGAQDNVDNPNTYFNRPAVQLLTPSATQSLRLRSIELTKRAAENRFKKVE